MSASIDPILPLLITISLSIVFISLLLKKFKQPLVIAYIIAGLLIGPYGLGLLTDISTITHLGNIGVVLLLFFIGMEVNLKKLLSNWKVALIGTLFQICLSVFFVYLFSLWTNWELKRILFLGFAISLSSTAVVLKILEEYSELGSKTGQNVLSILLVQDIAIVPMLLILSFLGGEKISYTDIIIECIGAVIIILFVIWLIKKENIKLPFSATIKKDHDLQIFWALLLCFGFALITGLFGLSTALGAFIAGIVLGSAKETKWVIQNLHPFYILLVALFFLSVGMLLDLTFILENYVVISTLVVGVFLTNTLINAIILKVLKNSWKESFYGGALLSEIGEFSFVLSAVASSLGIISTFGYNLTISVIALTLLFSPLWIAMFRKILLIHTRKNEN
ncbi:cation:proton antiporter [Candidatus Woesearchaeota archaeon]|nr:cation:proton antiporter [Candidatus Woesearchaeota archaeon]USN43518.1 MAG: cation:proton antiporter [Candidatus Woesearchaeota archaeon]